MHSDVTPLRPTDYIPMIKGNIMYTCGLTNAQFRMTKLWNYYVVNVVSRGDMCGFHTLSSE